MKRNWSGFEQQSKRLTRSTGHLVEKYSYKPCDGSKGRVLYYLRRVTCTDDLYTRDMVHLYDNGEIRAVTTRNIRNCRPKTGKVFTFGLAVHEGMPLMNIKKPWDT